MSRIILDAGSGRVAVVIAETYLQAKDAAELIDVDYDVLDAVVDVATATEPGRPQVHEMAPNNTCYVWGHGDKAAVERAFAVAAHVTLVFPSQEISEGTLNAAASILAASFHGCA